jgi:hypothetical protein
MLEDWINPDDNVKVATMMRFLSLVCGDGECADLATRTEVATTFVRKENSKMEEGHDSHVTHTSHTKVGAHSLSPPVLLQNFPIASSHDVEPCVGVCVCVCVCVCRRILLRRRPC